MNSAASLIHSSYKLVQIACAGEIKMHPWFTGVDWTDLARTKAAFVPVLDDDTDTSYFEKKAVSAKVGLQTQGGRDSGGKGLEQGGCSVNKDEPGN